MFTLQDVGRAQTRFPNWVVWLLAAGAIVWAIGSAIDAFPWQGSSTPAARTEQMNPAPAESGSSPTQSESGVIVPMGSYLVALNWQGVESLDFEYYSWGQDENGVIYGPERYGGAIKYGEFIGTGITQDAIVHIRDVRMIGGSSETVPLQFSPEGEHWFQAENLPEVPSGWAQIRGAVWDGDDILILANYQYEPWKYKGYVARVTPEDTKRASH